MIEPNYVMKGFCTRVIDGDTVVLSVSPAFKLIFQDYKFRLHGIDTPELNSKDPFQREQAQKAKDFVRVAIEGKDILVKSIRNSKGAESIDSFGRYLVEILYIEFVNVGGIMIPTQRNLNDELLSRGLATVWDGK